MPPKNNNVVGRGGGGPGGSGAGGGAAGGGGGGNFSTSGAKTGADKTAGGGNKGNSEYNSQARQHGSANNNKYSTSNPGLNNATITAESQKVITNISSLTQKRNKNGATSQSGNHTPYGVSTSQVRGEDSPVGTSPALRPRVLNVAKPGSCSPTRESPNKMAANRQKSREYPLKPYG